MDDPHPSRLALLAALVDSDVDLALRLALDLLGEGLTLEDIVSGFLGPVQGELGRRWADGDMSVADEHAASAAFDELLTRLGTTVGVLDGPRVVVASVQGDGHALGGRVVATVLGLDGVRVLYLGSSVPAVDLGEFVSIQEPDAVALSCSVSEALVGAAASIAAVHAVGVPVVLGGRGAATAQRAGRLGADAWAEGSGEAAAIMRRWAAERPVALAATPAPVPEHVALARRGPALTAVALDAASGSSESAGSGVVGDHAGFAAEVARLLRVIEGALLVGEPGLVDEHVAWLRNTGPAHGFPVHAIDASIAALAVALEGDLARAGELLRPLG
jgi:methanogenic corrinoid protein MtbC1